MRLLKRERKTGNKLKKLVAGLLASFYYVLIYLFVSST